MKKKIVAAGTGVIALLVLIVVVWFISLLATLPDVSALRNYRPSSAAEVFDRNGRTLATYRDLALRLWVPISDVPDHAIRAVVTAEDDTFFAHQGINYRSTWNALVHDVQKRRFARGGSTITQQMIKNVLLSKEKTLSRKVREYFLAKQAEETLTKRQILEIYLNEVEWGEQIYGIEAASRFYFDKHAGELTVGEAALLAGMLPNPRYFNPYRRPEKAAERQERVLSNMVQAKLITEEVFSAERAAPVRLRQETSRRFEFSPLSVTKVRPCYQRLLAMKFLEAYGEHGLYRQGRKVRTVLDKSLQDAVAAWEDSSEAAGAAVPESVVLIRQDGEVRALSCASNEDNLRSWIGPPDLPDAEYVLESVTVPSLDLQDLLARPVADSGEGP